ncbi:unnamed protein product [Gongylonema pulchrum]|uniref:BESS domain-containing protein n=1 Tax=Gongylonema pulchrum TaxID=637853 RepID=A0A183EJP0_9BILA|nr:unnamed protein product [Gongylonema pulchrum]
MFWYLQLSQRRSKHKCTISAEYLLKAPEARIDGSQVRNRWLNAQKSPSKEPEKQQYTPHAPAEVEKQQATPNSSADCSPENTAAADRGPDLLAVLEIRSGVRLQRIIPKTCPKCAPQDFPEYTEKKSSALGARGIFAKKLGADLRNRPNIGEILLEAMRKRRLRMRYDVRLKLLVGVIPDDYLNTDAGSSSSSSDQDESERDEQDWSDNDSDTDYSNDNDNNNNNISNEMRPLNEAQERLI